MTLHVDGFYPKVVKAAGGLGQGQLWEVGLISLKYVELELQKLRFVEKTMGQKKKQPAL